jgi:hypothetical protein
MNVEHVGSGKYSDVFRVSQDAKRPRSVMMKVMYYRDDTLRRFADLAKRGDLRRARVVKHQDAIAIGSEFGRVSKHLIESGVSPHFVLVFCDGDVKDFAEKLAPVLGERMAGLTRTQRKYASVCFMEEFDGDMTKYLQRGRYSEATLRGLVFQVLYTLACLQRALPGFRHNDLSTNNVLVKRLRRRASAKYALSGVGTWYVPDMPAFAALSDYDFVHVPGHAALTNERVVGGKYRVDGKPNVSYDTHFFLKSVYKCVHPRAARYPDAMRFLRGLGLQNEDRQDVEIPALDPARLLRNPYFDELRKPVAADYSYSNAGGGQGLRA